MVERERIPAHTPKPWRERGYDYQVADMLSYLSDVNLEMGLGKEGIQQAREASAMFEQLGDTVKQAKCLTDLARVLHGDKQIEAAEEPHPVRSISFQTKANNFGSA